MGWGSVVSSPGAVSGQEEGWSRFMEDAADGESGSGQMKIVDWGLEDMICEDL